MLHENENKDAGIVPDQAENKEVNIVPDQTENKEATVVLPEIGNRGTASLPEDAESSITGSLSEEPESSAAGIRLPETESGDEDTLREEAGSSAAAMLYGSESGYASFPSDEEEDYDWDDGRRKKRPRGRVGNWIAEHKLLTGVLIFWILYMLMYVIILGGANRYMTAAMDVAAVVSAVMTLAVVFFLFAHHVRAEKFFLPVFLLSGILFMIIMPLGQSPDEPVHLWQTYNLSNKMLGIDLGTDGYLIMEKSDRDVPMLGIPSNAELYEEYWEGIAAAGRTADPALVQADYKPLHIQDYLYLPQAAGVTVGRMLHLPAFWKFMLGRLFNLLFYALLAVLAMKMMPFGKMAVFMLSLTPISLQQCASLSYDAFVNSLAILVAALSFHLAFIPQPKQKVLKVILLWATALFLVPVKGGAYLPISLLPVIVWLYQRKRNRVLGGSAIAASLACVVLFAVTRFVPLPVFAEDAPAVTAQSVIEEVQTAAAPSAAKEGQAETAPSAAEKEQTGTAPSATEKTQSAVVQSAAQETPANIAPYVTEGSKEEAAEKEKELPKELTPQERALQEATEKYGIDLPYTSDKGYSLRFFLHRPLDLFAVIGNTMQVNDGWYLESFLGDNLGWMAIRVSKVILYLMALLLFLGSIRDQDEEDFEERNGLLLGGGLSLISMALVFAGMLISWSPISGQMIAGVQGRYFIPVALPLLMCFRLLPVKKESSKMDKGLVLAVCLVLFFVIRFLLLGLNIGPQ